MPEKVGKRTASDAAYIGLDVHKESISVAVAEADRGAEVRSLGSIAHTDEAVVKLVRRLTDRHGRLEFIHEAGPCGYGLHRQLERLGHAAQPASSGGDRAHAVAPIDAASSMSAASIVTRSSGVRSRRRMTRPAWASRVRSQCHVAAWMEKSADRCRYYHLE